MRPPTIPPRPGGAAVDDEGVEILSAPRRLNFTGPGVTVTDAGSGVANVAIAGGGGAGFEEVANFAALPAAGDHTDETYAVLAGQGVWFINRKPAGFYRSDGAAWVFLGDLSDPYFVDNTLKFSDEADPTKVGTLDLSTVPTGTNVEVQWPAQDGQLALVSQITKAQVGLSDADNTSDEDKPVSTAQQAALDLKVDKNGAITGATKTKVTYDSKGLVTAGTDATTADIPDSTNKRYVTDAQSTVLGNTSGTNTGDQTSVSGNAGTATALQTARTIGGVSFDGTANIALKVEWGAAFSDETTALTTGTKLTKRLGFAMSLTSVYVSLTTAPTGAALILDIKKNGTTIFSTKPSIDVSEKSTATAATASVLSSNPTSIAADDELTFILDQVGATIAGAGGSVVLIGTRS
jgi:hypothetical protein